MPVPLFVLVAYVSWAVFLGLLVVAWRLGKVTSGQAVPADFPAGVPHGSEAYWRANRAHLNTLENLPLFAAVVLTAAILEVPGTIFATLASVVLAGRVLQSIIHLMSGSNAAVNIRFLFWLVQLVAILFMVALIVIRAGFPDWPGPGGVWT